MKRVALFFTMIGISLLLSADTVLVDVKWNWPEREVKVEYTAELLKRGPVPLRKRETEMYLQKYAMSSIYNEMGSLTIDSQTTLSEVYEKNHRMSLLFLDAIGKIAKRGMKTADNLNRVTVSYTIPLDALLADFFVVHKEPEAPYRIPGYIPQNVYTGVIIYANTPLPLWGDGRAVSLTPAIFPKVFDEDFRPILYKEIVYPDVISDSGMARYFTEEEPQKIFEAVGSFPYRTVATEIFGYNETDLVITKEAAKVILGNSYTREHIQRGRVVFIVSPATL